MGQRQGREDGEVIDEHQDTSHHPKALDAINESDEGEQDRKQQNEDIENRKKNSSFNQKGRAQSVKSTKPSGRKVSTANVEEVPNNNNPDNEEKRMEKRSFSLNIRKSSRATGPDKKIPADRAKNDQNNNNLANNDIHLETDEDHNDDSNKDKKIKRKKSIVKRFNKKLKKDKKWNKVEVERPDDHANEISPPMERELVNTRDPQVEKPILPTTDDDIASVRGYQEATLWITIKSATNISFNCDDFQYVFVAINCPSAILKRYRSHTEHVSNSPTWNEKFRFTIKRDSADQMVASIDINIIIAAAFKDDTRNHLILGECSVVIDQKLYRERDDCIVDLKNEIPEYKINNITGTVSMTWEFSSLQIKDDYAIICPNATKIYDSYVIDQQVLLGEGAYSKVIRGKTKKDDKQLAIKIVDSYTNMLEKGILDSFLREIYMLRKLKHPHIVQIMEVHEDAEHFYVVMELLGGGDAFDRLVEVEVFPEPRAAYYINQILEALDYMHSMAICHRDLKIENLVFKDPSLKHLKIIDFGEAKSCSDGKLMDMFVGTVYYAAPEVLWGRPYNTLIDLWSLGVISYVMLAGEQPFYGDDDTEVMKQIKKMAFDFSPDVWDNVSREAKDFVSKLLSPSSTRISAAEAMAHTWIVTQKAKPWQV